MIVESEWTCEGYKCKVICIPYGHRCGYVGINKSHPLYGKTYMTLEEDFNVHGGITYSGYMEGETDWFFGFDTAHAGDKTDPEILKMFDTNYTDMSMRGVVRTSKYCVKETNSLAKQLKDLEEK